MKIRGRKTSIQSVRALAIRYRNMANTFNKKLPGEMTEQEKATKQSLEEQALHFEEKASIFPKTDAFTMIL